MDDKARRKRQLELYRCYPGYDFMSKVVREIVALELEEMAAHPSLSGDMKWALTHAAKMITAGGDSSER